MSDETREQRRAEQLRDEEERKLHPRRSERPRPDTRRPDPDLPGTPATTTEAMEGPEGRAAGVEGGPELSGRRASLWADAWRDLRRRPTFIASAALIAAFLLMAYVPETYLWFYPGITDPHACEISRSVARPSGTNWFGFDLQGCDYYARVIHGANVSISIGLVVTGFAAVIAVVLGSLAGYYGRFVDALIARITDIWFAIPIVLGGIVVLSVLDQTFRNVSLVLILLGWPTMLRLMRSSVLEHKESDYVDAARALGASDVRIIGRHILPNAIQPVIVYGTIYVGIIISVEATLSFLGVGLELPAITWGLMINNAQTRVLSSPHLLFFPGAILSFAVFAFILMGDALRDALDPKLR